MQSSPTREERARFGRSGDDPPGGDSPPSTPAEIGYNAAEPGCTCGGYTYKATEEIEDPRTGEVQTREVDYTRRNTDVFCPVHGVNDDYKAAFAEHAGWIARRGGYERRDLFHITIRLHESDLERAGLDATDTRSVLAQLTPRLRKRTKRRDEGREALISFSPRPSDGQYHLHILLYSQSCNAADVVDAFTVAGTNVQVTTPFSRAEQRDEPPMSAERFASSLGAYLFQNRVEGAQQGAETRFSSWKARNGEGVGFFSSDAKERRRQYAQKMSDEDGEGSHAPAHCTTLEDRTRGDTDATGSEDERPERAAVPPVHVGVETVDTEEEYRRVVLGALSDRLHTEVPVSGIGRALLTWVEVGDEDLIICCVRPLERESDDPVEVPWRMIEATGTPVIRRSASSPSSGRRAAPDSTTSGDEGTGEEDTGSDAESAADEGSSTAERYWTETARYSVVSYVRPDGRREVRTTDHKTGEVEWTVKPPR